MWENGDQDDSKVFGLSKRTIYHQSTEGKPAGAAQGEGRGREQGLGLGRFSWKAHEIPVQGRGEAGGRGEPSKFLESEDHKKASTERARGAPAMPGQKNNENSAKEAGGVLASEGRGIQEIRY